MNNSVPSQASNLRPPRQGYVIDRETLARLDDLERIAAKSAIRRGFWIMIDDDVIPCKVSP